MDLNNNKQTLRVLIASDAAPSRNGVGAYYEDLFEPLAARVHTLRLFSPRIDGNGRWQAALSLPLPGDRTQRLCLPSLPRLRHLFAEVQPNIVVVATPGLFGLSAALLASSRNIPLVSAFHTSFTQLTALYWPGPLRGRLVGWYFRRANRSLLTRSCCVLGNSPTILAEAQALHACETQLIGTPVARDFLAPARRAHSGTLRRFLFAGRLAREKNLQEVLDAATALPNLQFAIAGDGPLRTTVEVAAQRLPNLRYLGWLEREALRQALDEHDALLLPSHFETFGTVALEAMARQRLAIVSPGCGITDWPTLRPSLAVMQPGETLLATLERLAVLTPQQILAQVDDGRLAAEQLNAQVADEWLRVLTQHANKEP